MSRCDFGPRLRRLREERAISQVEMARRLKTTAPTISNWEKGIRTPHFTHLCNLADAFGVSLDRLMRGHDYVPGGVP